MLYSIYIYYYYIFLYICSNWDIFCSVLLWFVNAIMIADDRGPEDEDYGSATRGRGEGESYHGEVTFILSLLLWLC